MKPVLSLLLGLITVSLAAPSNAIPVEPLANKGRLLFQDDFKGSNVSPLWHKVVPTFVVTNGVLRGTQTRERDVTLSNGTVVKAHAAVHGLSLPTTNSITEFKFWVEGNGMVDIEWDDRAWTNSHYGHLFRAQFRTNGVTLMDEREGSQNLAVKALLADPATKAEGDKRMAGKHLQFPVAIPEDGWHTAVVEVFWGQMRVLVDGKPVAYMRSPGIGHPTKSKIEFGVAGKVGFFSDLKIWNAVAIPKPPPPKKVDSSQ